jgi:2,3-bisphosphoglycerate-dependent phosphoglycerate mutase
MRERRLSEHIDIVFCSDLRRAVETAELAFGRADVPIRYDWRLRECNRGN